MDDIAIGYCGVLIAVLFFGSNFILLKNIIINDGITYMLKSINLLPLCDSLLFIHVYLLLLGNVEVLIMMLIIMLVMIMMMMMMMIMMLIIMLVMMMMIIMMIMMMMMMMMMMLAMMIILN